MKERFLTILSVCIAISLFSCGKTLQAPDRIEVAVPYEFDTLDPHVQNALSNFAVLSNFYEPLVSTDATMRITPCIARRWENPDLSTWIFYLRPGVRFHNGKTLVAEDVVYTFDRLLSNRELEMAGYLVELTKVTTIDSTTVKIQTELPSSILLNKLRFIHIISKDSGDLMKQQINGTGPYRLESWDRKETVVLSRNEDYWGATPFLKRAVIHLNRSPNEALEGLLNGAISFAQCNSKKVKKRLSEEKRVVTLQSDSMFVKYLGYDLARDETPFCSVKPNPFKNLNVRLAIHLAIDRKKIVDSLATQAVPANQPLPPFIFGYNPDIPDTQYDLNEARQLMARAGLPDGFEVTLHVRKLFEDAGLLVRDQLAQIGIRVKVAVLPDTEILPGLRKHDYTFYLSRIGSPTGDASDVTDNCLHSPDATRRYGIMNFGQYSNQEVDRAIEESSRIQLIERRRSVLHGIMDTVMKDVAWVPLYIDQDIYAIDKAYSWKPRNDSFILISEINPAIR